MAIIKCKMCGGELAVVEGSTLAVCEFCGTRQTVPGGNDEKKLTLFQRANRWRQECDFDRAAGIYETIVADFPDEAEAYWGLVLCKYGIEYVDDTETGKMIPTCHRTSFDSVLEDPDYLQTQKVADPEAARAYRMEARQLERNRKGILELAGSEAPYDIFICYKETDPQGQRTPDSVLAQEIYNALTEQGYRVFFSRISLEDKLGQAYEPFIFSALHSARLMLTVSTEEEYINATWVRNEWSRFLKLQGRGEKKYLVPCYKDMDPYDLPKEFRHLQSQDLGKLGAVQDLIRGIGKLIQPENKTEPEAPSVRSAEPQISPEEHRVQVHNRATEALYSDSLKEIKEAIKALRAFPDWEKGEILSAQLKQRQKQLKNKKHNKRALIFFGLFLAGFLGVLLWSMEHFYQRGLESAWAGEYNDAISLLEKNPSYRDSAERIQEYQVKKEQAEQALLPLLPHKDDWGNRVGYYQDSETGFWLKFWNGLDDIHGPRIVVDPNSKDEALNYIFNPKGDQFYIHYDQYSQEYVFVDWNDEGGFSEFYRGKLNPDGTLYVYGPGGVSFLLIPRPE